jgi:type VI secretion system secreted protein Hcp
MAVDMFLKIDGIDGESADKQHRGEIEILSFSWGESNSGSSASGGGGGSGKVAMQDFHFVTRIDKSTPKLFLSVATGEHIKQAVLTLRKAGTTQFEFLKWTFTDVLISSFQHAGSEGDALPAVQLSLGYAAIAVDYTPQNADGSAGTPIHAGWNLKENKSV